MIIYRISGRRTKASGLLHHIKFRGNREYCRYTNNMKVKQCTSVWLLCCCSSLEQNTALSRAFLDKVANGFKSLKGRKLFYLSDFTLTIVWHFLALLSSNFTSCHHQTTLHTEIQNVAPFRAAQTNTWALSLYLFTEVLLSVKRMLHLGQHDFNFLGSNWKLKLT